MSIFNDKTLKSVADAARKVMEEELKGGQKNLDKNNNNKIDSEDFRLLRGEKKAPFTGGKEKSETVTDKSGAKHGPMSKARDLARRALRNEDVEQVDESVWDYKNSATEKKTGATTRTGHDVRKTSTGTVYTKRAAEDKPEEPKSRKKQNLGATSDLMSDEEFKRKHGMSRKNYERMQSGMKIGESFTAMLEAYDEYGLAAFASLNEEPDNEQFTAELKRQERKAAGKAAEGEKAQVAKPTVLAVKEYKDGAHAIKEEHKCSHPKNERCDKCPDPEMKEEVEQIDEARVEHLAMAPPPHNQLHVIKNFKYKRGTRDPEGAADDVHHRVAVAAAKIAKVPVEHMRSAMETKDHFHFHAGYADAFSHKKPEMVHNSVDDYVKHHAPKAAALIKKPIKEEVEQIDEARVEHLAMATPNSQLHVIRDYKFKRGIRDVDDAAADVHHRVAVAAAKIAKVPVEHMRDTMDQKMHGHDHAGFADAFSHKKPAMVHNSVDDYVKHHAPKAAALIKKPIKEEISTAQMSHQGKTTLKHIKNPGVELRMAAHDVKPGVSGYRDRIDLLKAAKAQGKLKEENDKESDAEKNKEETKKTFPNVKHFTKSGHPDWKKHGYKDMPVKEEVEQIDEISKDTLTSYSSKAWAQAQDKKTSPEQRAKRMMGMTKSFGKQLKNMNQEKEESAERRKNSKLIRSEEVEQIDELKKSTLASYAKKATDDVSYHSYAQGHGRTTDAKYHDQKAMKRQAGVNKAIDRLAKEEVELDERHLTSSEMEAREKNVKGMKKKLSGFKSRYGERAKEVMYATATKMAKGDKE